MSATSIEARSAAVLRFNAAMTPSGRPMTHVTTMPAAASSSVYGRTEATSVVTSWPRQYETPNRPVRIFAM
jgi:hypothetical protein